MSTRGPPTASSGHADLDQPRSSAKHASTAVKLDAVSRTGASPSAWSEAAIASAMDPIIAIDERGIILRASDSVQRVFGWPARELEGQSITLLMPAPHRGMHDTYLANPAAPDESAVLGKLRTFDAVKRDGTLFPIEISVSRIDCDDPSAPRFVAIIRDISERRRLERHLELVRSVAVACSRGEALGAVLETVLRHVLEYAGWDYGEAWSVEHDELVRIAAWPGPAPRTARALNAPRMPRDTAFPQCWCERPGGEWFGDLSDSSVGLLRTPGAAAAGFRAGALIPIWSEGKMPGVVVCFARSSKPGDTSSTAIACSALTPVAWLLHREHASRELERSEAQLRAAFELAAAGQFLCRPGALRFERVNVRLCELMGYTEPELLNLTLPEIVHPDERADTTQRLHASASHGKPSCTLERRLVRANGEHLWVRIEVVFIRCGAGPERALGIVQDITRRRQQDTDSAAHSAQLEQLVYERNREIEQSHAQLRISERLASLGTLAAGLGHDMHNVLLPVRAHLNAVLAAKTGAMSPSEVKMHINAVRRSVGYLQQLADGLHFLSSDPGQPASGRGTDLGHWWKVAGPLLSAAVPRHVTVSARMPEGLPRVGIGSAGLTQAVLNLVVNAGDAIPPPAPGSMRRGQVLIWAACANDAATDVTIGVTDDGQGMTDSVRERACEAFFTTKARGLGTGLGLALVRKIMTQAGGAIEIDSKVGVGTTVRLKCPVFDAHSRSASGDRGTAVVSVQDPRAAAVVLQLLDLHGVRAQQDAEPGLSGAWVAEPDAASLAAARAWRASCPGGRLILMGSPPASEIAQWAEMKPRIIHNSMDLAEVRRVIAGLTEGGP